MRVCTDKHQPISATYGNLLDLTDDTKIIAAAEIGSVMDPAQLEVYQADWAWYVVWNGEYLSGGVWNSLEMSRSEYDVKYVLTLEEIQGWRGK